MTHIESKQMISFSIKQRNKGKWHHLKVADLTGQTLRQVLQTINGTEAVAEFIIDDQKIYFCGTKLWLERMSKKGKVVTFEMLVKVLEVQASNVLDEPLPGVDLISDIFDDSSLCTVGPDSN